MTLVYDTLIVGAEVGRVFQHDYDYAWFVATVATVTMVLMLLVAMLLVGACLEMEHPLGGDAMDLPGLSYVAGVADLTLGMIARPAGSSARTTLCAS